MSHIYPTVLAIVQQSNCAKLKALTFSVIYNIDTSRNNFILQLHDPWIAENGQRPMALHLRLIFTMREQAKIRHQHRQKPQICSSVINTYLNYVLAIAVDIYATAMEITNLDATTTTRPQGSSSETTARRRACWQPILLTNTKTGTLKKERKLTI